MRKIKVPRKIRVGGIDYTIVKPSKKTDRQLYSNGLDGHHGAYTHELVVSSILSEEDASLTLLHEILHAIDTVYNNHGLDERTVSVISNGLYQALRELGVRFVL